LDYNGERGERFPNDPHHRTIANQVALAATREDAMLHDDRINLELDKLHLENRKLAAEARKFAAEECKLRKEAFCYPLTVGTAFMVAVAGILSLLIKL